MPRAKTTPIDPNAPLSLPEAKAALSLDLEGIPLAPKELKFVLHYVTNGFNEVTALKDAGYFTPKGKGPLGAQHQANTILRSPNVVEAIKRFVDSSLEPYRARLELEIMQIYYKRATYSLATFYNPRGTPKPLTEIPEEWHCCLDATARRYSGATQYHADKHFQEYTLPNRDQALQMLYRMVKGVNVDEDPDRNLLPGETRTKLKAIWEGKDLKGIMTKVTSTLERKAGTTSPKPKTTARKVN